MLKCDNLSPISFFDLSKTKIFSMNTGKSEIVSSICNNDLAVSLTDTEQDRIPLLVDSNICTISY